jgi:hypothetical protein
VNLAAQRQYLLHRDVRRYRYEQDGRTMATRAGQGARLFSCRQMQVATADERRKGLKW